MLARATSPEKTAWAGAPNKTLMNALHGDKWHRDKRLCYTSPPLYSLPTNATIFSPTLLISFCVQNLQLFPQDKSCRFTYIRNPKSITPSDTFAFRVVLQYSPGDMLWFVYVIRQCRVYTDSTFKYTKQCPVLIKNFKTLTSLFTCYWLLLKFIAKSIVYTVYWKIIS